MQIFLFFIQYSKWSNIFYFSFKEKHVRVFLRVYHIKWNAIKNILNIIKKNLSYCSSIILMFLMPYFSFHKCQQKKSFMSSSEHFKGELNSNKRTFTKNVIIIMISILHLIYWKYVFLIKIDHYSYPSLQYYFIFLVFLILFIFHR